MERKINQMTELQDMGRFPPLIYVGATSNILLTITLTWKMHHWCAGDWFYLLPWAVLLPSLNIVPVVLLRFFERPSADFPLLSEMRFFQDQHRFSSWVYAVAAGNMFFWIVFSWWAFHLSSTVLILLIVCLIAVGCTFVPLWRKYVPALRM